MHAMITSMVSLGAEEPLGILGNVQSRQKPTEFASQPILPEQLAYDRDESSCVDVPVCQCADVLIRRLAELSIHRFGDMLMAAKLLGWRCSLATAGLWKLLRACRDLP